MQPPDYRSILRQYWGYDDFRGVQRGIIESIGAGRDTLGLMPTGGGKSVTFQVPAMAREGLCLVVTPLVALMKDQVENLRKRGIKALALHAGMGRQDIIATLENCIFGNYKFLYVSPERLASDLFRAKLRKMRVSMIAVDESHCISQWGYDFRPAYLQIAEARQCLPGVPVLALTATATPEVVEDIQERLGFKEPNVFKMSFGRANLAYMVRRTGDKAESLLRTLRQVPGSAIVYARSRKRAREVAELLNHEGITADFYHAGLDDAARDLRQHAWQDGRCRVIVATNAFGMGIDKPDVRLVAHIDLPDSPEAYFQEAGRAGRDGKPAYAVILYDPASDKASLQARVAAGFPDKETVKTVYEHLQYYFQMAMGDGLGCTRQFDLDDFCVKFRHYPAQADSALKLLGLAGYLEYTEAMDNASRFMFIVRRDELYRLHALNNNTELLIRLLLRNYTGLFSDYAFISEEMLSTKSGLARRQVYESLVRLARLGIASYIPRRRTPYIIYTRERIESDSIRLPASIYEERKVRAEKRAQAMLAYVSDEQTCRSRLLLRYFGEDDGDNCGRCDICLNSKHTALDPQPSTAASLSDRLLQLIASEQPVTLDALNRKLNADPQALVQTIHTLVDCGHIATADNLYCLSRNKSLLSLHVSNHSINHKNR